LTTASTPAPAARPAWKEALFNYGTLVATLVAVLGTLFGQISALRELSAVANTQLTEIERRLGKAEERDEQARERDEKMLAMIAAMQASIARIEARLEAKP
jgi:septal ring factor EnvC (AmiA/AmiB activator)